MSTIQEIKTAIAKLNPRDKALLAAELFATNDAVDDAKLEAALQQGLKTSSRVAFARSRK